MGNCRPSSRDKRPDVGDVGHDGTVVGVLARLRRRTTLPGRGQARAAEEAEEIRFADVEALPLERGADVGQGGPLAAELAGPLAGSHRVSGMSCDRARRWRRSELTSGSRAKSRTIARTVSDMKMKPLGDFIGGCGFVEVSAADLVVAVGR